MEDVVDVAKRVILDLLQVQKNDKKMIKVTQIRKFLAAVNSLTNKIERYKLLNPKEFKENGIPEDLAAEIQYLRVSLAYQSGRYPEEVKVFEYFFINSTSMSS